MSDAFRPLIPHGSAYAAAPRRRDRHGRGLRGPLIPPALPAWRTRAERFDDAVIRTLESLERSVGPELDGVEVAVEEVPPSAPAPWETGATPLGRYFAADSAAGLPHRIVVYRQPVIARCEDEPEIGGLIREVLVEQVAHLIGRHPGDVDPNYSG